jgi:hypothetical protein
MLFEISSSFFNAASNGQLSATPQDFPWNFADRNCQSDCILEAIRLQTRQDEFGEIRIIGRFFVAFEEAVAPKDPIAPDDEVTFATVLAPYGRKERRRSATDVEGPCLSGAGIKIDDQGFTATIRAFDQQCSGSTAEHSCRFSGILEQAFCFVPELTVPAVSQPSNRIIHCYLRPD